MTRAICCPVSVFSSAGWTAAEGADDEVMDVGRDGDGGQADPDPRESVRRRSDLAVLGGRGAYANAQTMSYTHLLAALTLGLGLLTSCAAKQSTGGTQGKVARQIPNLTVEPLSAPLRGDYAVFQAAIYFPAKPAVDPKRVFRELASKRAPELEIVAEGAEPTDLPAVFVGQPKIEDYAPPTLESLAYFGRGLTDEEKRVVASSKHVLTFAFLENTADAAKGIARASTLLSGVAERSGGYVWDESTRELFSKAAFAERNAQATTSVLDQIALHSYADGTFLRIVTLGMQKLGLPDLELNHVIGHDARPAGILVNMLCQRLIEGAAPDSNGRFVVAIDEIQDGRTRALSEPRGEGAQGRTELLLRDGKPREGDPENRLLEVFFGESKDVDVHERRARALYALLGRTDNIVNVEHDQALLAASARARSRLMALKPAFLKQADSRERLAVKAPFVTDDGGTEWMWVEVVRWEGKTIYGVLLNEPAAVSKLVPGAKVEVAEDEVFDYMLTHADGTSEGNETQELLH